MGGRAVVVAGLVVALLSGCLAKSQGAKLGGAGFAIIAGTVVVVVATGCQDDTLDCGLANSAVAAIPLAIGTALLAGGLDNFILGSDDRPAHDASPIFVPSRARYLMASAGVVARRGDCATARTLAARAHAADPVIAAAYAGDLSLAACLTGPPRE
jgi:hypothetical protein